MMQLRAEADMGKMCLFLVSLSSPVIRPWWWHWKTSRAPVIINLLPSNIRFRKRRLQFIPRLRFNRVAVSDDQLGKVHHWENNPAQQWNFSCCSAAILFPVRQFFFLCGKYMSTILIDNRDYCTICSAAIPFSAWKNPAKIHNKDDFCKPVVNCRTGNRPNQTNTCIKECRWQRIFILSLTVVKFGRQVTICWTCFSYFRY